MARGHRACLQQVPFAKFPTHGTQKLLTSEGCVPVTPERRILKKHLPVVSTVEEGEGTGQDRPEFVGLEPAQAT